ILKRLDGTFVTPFDREDIHALAEELDDVVDDMLTVSHLLRLLSIETILPAIGELEHEGDDVYRRTLARLFSGEYEALEVLRWKDIVQAMEAAINTVEDISNIVEAIILKHA